MPKKAFIDTSAPLIPFQPTIFWYTPWYPGINPFMIEAFPNAKFLRGGAGIASALDTLEKSEELPDAYVLEANTFGNPDPIRSEEVSYVLELLIAHKKRITQGQPTPLVFLLRGQYAAAIEGQKLTAQRIAGATRFTVYGFNEAHTEFAHKLPDNMHSFEPMIKQAWVQHPTKTAAQTDLDAQPTG